jgi:hypothetical protein
MYSLNVVQLLCCNGDQCFIYLQGGGSGGFFASWRAFDWRDWGEQRVGSFFASMKGMGQVIAAVLLIGFILVLGALACVNLPPVCSADLKSGCLFSSTCMLKSSPLPNLAECHHVAHDYDSDDIWLST